MLKGINFIISLVAVFVTFLLFTLINNQFFGGWRLDLTANKLYTLSAGTEEILQDIEEPINLYFFFSNSASEDLTSLRSYARRVQEMLEEYALGANGKLKLQVIDPEAFSEEEDQAAGFGLQKVPINQSGQEIYFGLAATNALDDLEIIPFFQLDREEFLEYELSKLVYNLSTDGKFALGIFSSLPVTAQTDPRTYQVQPAWVVVQQLQELFQVRELMALSRETLAGLELLLLIQPKTLDDSQRFVIDQFVMAGGKLLVFVDPLVDTEAPRQAPPMGAATGMNPLLEKWGLQFSPEQVLGDAKAALMVNLSSGASARHLGILGFTPDNFADDDLVMASLEGVNFSTAGILSLEEVPGIDASVLIASSTVAMPFNTFQFQFLSSPEDLQQGFAATGEAYPVAVRLSGTASTAYPEGIEGYEGEVIQSTEQLQVVVVADTDLLSDRLWVQVQHFFGQQITSAFADNGSFVINLVDNLSGSNALISVRSRGQFSRPFTRVEALRRRAEASYLKSSEDLQARLRETEAKLSELQSARINDGALTLTPEQNAALKQFQDEQLIIRKQLRSVRHQLNKDISSLGAGLKFLNIVLLPLLLTGFLLVGRRLNILSRRGKAS